MTTNPADLTTYSDDEYYALLPARLEQDRFEAEHRDELTLITEQLEAVLVGVDPRVASDVLGDLLVKYRRLYLRPSA